MVDDRMSDEIRKAIENGDASYSNVTYVDGFDTGSAFDGFLAGAPVWFVIPFVLIAALIIGAIVFAIIKGSSTYMKNNASDIERVEVRLIGKRNKVWGGSGDRSASTSYYLTFEAENGDRKEFQVNGEQYGLNIEGDEGLLTFQGTRFKSFERNIQT
ncbi:DUF2500 domain-containing protein [Saccharibacillus sp. JS10]|uniref:DUF2500 domain-containing protein n=1 Tax=Saccharibacillus sp. JS10 TaxID=2950552 RepID=UPI00210ABB2F|nr:DUF2500 domain-containing protein [Saccharibacillus sp. JS10]MCQ4087118.1 DUF2500 domain-containing protein [Saccharibacillus sp. JS10]